MDVTQQLETKYMIRIEYPLFKRLRRSKESKAISALPLNTDFRYALCRPRSYLCR